MKKLLGVLTICALAATAFGQGQVGFINNTAGLVRQWTSLTDSTPIGSPVGGAQVELFTASAGTTFSPMGTYSGANFLPAYPTLAAFLAANAGWSAIATTGITPVAGRFNGGTVNSSVAYGVNAEYVILGWTGATGTTWDQAFGTAGAFLGTSAEFTTATGNPTTTPPGTAVLLSATLTGMTPVANTAAYLTPIPEPTSFALAGLGLAALLVFRRRN